MQSANLPFVSSTFPLRGHPGYNPDLMVMDLAKLRGDKEYKASFILYIHLRIQFTFSSQYYNRPVSLS